MQVLLAPSRTRVSSFQRVDNASTRIALNAVGNNHYHKLFTARMWQRERLAIVPAPLQRVEHERQLAGNPHIFIDVESVGYALDTLYQVWRQAVDLWLGDHAAPEPCELAVAQPPGKVSPPCQFIASQAPPFFHSFQLIFVLHDRSRVPL